VKYLLDTNIIVDHLRGKKSLEIAVLKKGSAVSIITRAELFYGAYKSTQTAKNLNKIEQMFADLDIEIISLDEKALHFYGKIKTKLETKGQKLDEFDLLVAATCLANNLTLVTQNLKHFQRIPQLKLF